MGRHNDALRLGIKVGMARVWWQVKLYNQCMSYLSALEVCTINNNTNPRLLYFYANISTSIINYNCTFSWSSITVPLQYSWNRQILWRLPELYQVHIQCSRNLPINSKYWRCLQLANQNWHCYTGCAVKSVYRDWSIATFDGLWLHEYYEGIDVSDFRLSKMFIQLSHHCTDTSG